MTGFHVLAGSTETLVHPPVRRIGVSDLVDALHLGFSDFWEKPSHYVFLCLIYPLVGVVLATWTSGNNALPLLFPLMSGFALIGPFAALGLYEISRRREAGLDTSWWHALEVRQSPAIPSIIAVGLFLLAIFIVWLLAAQAVYMWCFGPNPPASLGSFVTDVLTTSRGWTLIIVGNLVGLVFAIVVLATTVIAFPILLDRDIGAYDAMHTSVRALLANPIPMLVWGLIVAALLMIGSIPLFAGLAVVIPILGHATWHLYRKVIAAPTGPARRELGS